MSRKTWVCLRLQTEWAGTKPARWRAVWRSKTARAGHAAKQNATRSENLLSLTRAMMTVGADIFDAAQADPDLEGMGTTLTALWVQGRRAYIAHVGDSRAYLYRDGKVQQLTFDHSWVAEQVRAGFLTEQEARESRFRHIITRSVGFERDVQVDGAMLPVRVGDCCFCVPTDCRTLSKNPI